MKKTGFIVLLAIVASTYVTAQSYKNALGVRFSSNDAAVSTGITYKHFFGSTALEALVSFGDPFAIGALIEKYKPTSVTDLNWFYGGGAYAGFSDNKYFGAQGVIGLDYKFKDLPINLSLDWKPELNIINTVDFEPAAVGFSVRFTLN